jgi:predicted transcriptional regulator
MIHIPQKPVLVPMSVRLSPETAEKVRSLAESLSVGGVRVTEAAVLRQIITDFFSTESVQNVNGGTQ